MELIYLIVFIVFFALMIVMVFSQKKEDVQQTNTSINSDEAVKFSIMGKLVDYEGDRLTPLKKIKIDISKKYITVYQDKTWDVWKEKLKIDAELITDITLWTKGHRKNKWVVGRAIIGTVIVGGLGAILGGMTGLKPTDLIEFIISFHAGENKLNVSIETVKQNQVEKLASKLYNFVYKSKIYLGLKEESIF